MTESHPPKHSSSASSAPPGPALEPVCLPNTAPGTDALALAAVAEIRSGMIVGMGTGRTASRAVRALAHRYKEEKLDIDCVSTSATTESLARELGLPTVPFADIEVVDYLFDGANEVDYQLRMLKGHHGAITRQRLVAEVSSKCVYLAHEDKLVPRLGGVVRCNLDGEMFISEGGGVVLDVRLPERDLVELANELDHVAGVVDHGLFLCEADEVLIECKHGVVKRMQRPA